MTQIKFYNRPTVPLEMHKVKIVQKLNLLPAAQRLEKMQQAGLDVDGLDALSLAEQAGSSKAVNIVLMGHLSRYFDFTEEEWLEALEQSVAPKFLEMNKKAFAMGRNA